LTVGTRDDEISDRLFHLDSAASRQRVDEPDPAAVPPQRRRVYVGAERIALPGRDFALAAPLGDLLRHRRSRRDFSGRPLDLERVGRLLNSSFGVVADREVFGVETSAVTGYRASPSAGGLYPLELYVTTRDVDGLDDGVYHYDAWSHQLELRQRGSIHERFAEICFGQGFLAAANLLITIAAIVERTRHKYGPRGYRYVCFEAGHVVQNVCLVAAASDLGAVALGGFYDREMNELLTLPEGEDALYHVAVGTVGGVVPAAGAL
jgi:SagB-type dehydrogenase family enzyme